jgi:hypothetical protein
MLDEYDRRTIGVRKLVRRLIKANSTVPGITDYRWKVYVIDDDTFENAFASPVNIIQTFIFDQLGWRNICIYWSNTQIRLQFRSTGNNCFA